MSLALVQEERADELASCQKDIDGLSKRLNEINLRAEMKSDESERLKKSILKMKEELADASNSSQKFVA